MTFKDFYTEAENAEYNDITFGLFNRIDDDKIPYAWGKKMNQIYGIDDFVYTKLDLDKKEQFLLKMHNKDFLRRIELMKKKYDGTLATIYVDYDEGEVTIIKLKN